MRCQRFLKGEDVLLLGWAGTAPPRAAAANGVGLDLPPADQRRDGSGVPLAQPVHAVAGAVGQNEQSAAGAAGTAEPIPAGDPED